MLRTKAALSPSLASAKLSRPSASLTSLFALKGPGGVWDMPAAQRVEAFSLEFGGPLGV